MDFIQSLIDYFTQTFPDKFPDEKTAREYILSMTNTDTQNIQSPPESTNGSFPGDNEYNNKKDTGKITAEEEQELDQIKTDLNSDNLIKKTMRAHGVFEASDMKYNTEFYPLQRNDPFNRVEGTREIVFFTKPSLPFLKNNTGELKDEFAETPYFNNLYSRGYTRTLVDLSYPNGGGGTDPACPFIHILTNRITAPIDIPDIAVDELETAQNMWGTRLLYPKSSMSSDEGLDFTCEFEDTKYLEIYHLFKAWDLYRQGKWWGIFSPDKSYIANKILYDQIAVYKFTIAEDGETLLHWCKWIGVYPKNISRSSFSEIPKEGPLKITVSFKLSGWFEDMEPNIISDFNQLIIDWAGSSTITKDHIYDIWSNDIGMVSQDNVMYPFIVKGTPNSDGYTPYYFEWTRNS